MMRFKRFTILAVVFSWSVLISSFSIANDVDVRASASKTKIQVAEPFQFEVLVTAPAGTRLVFPQVGQRLGDFDILSHRDMFDLPGGDEVDQRKWIRRLTLETIETGELTIPPIEISVLANQAASADIVRTEPLAISVVSVLENRVEPTNFRDIKGVVDAEVLNESQMNWLVWFAAGGVGAAALAFVVFIATRRRADIEPIAWVRGELEDLLSSVKSRQSELQFTMSRLQAMLRTYLEAEFGFPATAFSPAEIVDELNRRLETDQFAARLQALFDRVEQARFAGVALSQDDVESLIQQTKVLVDEIHVLRAEHEEQRGTA